MRVEQYHPSQQELWDGFVRRSKNGTFLFLRDYMDYHRDRFSDSSLIIHDERERVVALLPAVRTGSTVNSHGGLTYGGFVTDADMKVTKMLAVFEDVLTFFQSQGIRSLIYKTVPHIYHKLPAAEDLYALFLCGARVRRRGVLAVCDADSRLDFQERRTRAIKRAIKANLLARPSTDFAAYWVILMEILRQQYNTNPVHSLAEIAQLHSSFPRNIKLYACYEHAAMLAGVVVYESDQVAHLQYIAASDRGKELGALDLIFDLLLNGVYCRKPFFDFGTSDENDGWFLNAGLIDHKEGFGARAVVHDHYEIDLTTWQPGSLIKVLG